MVDTLLMSVIDNRETESRKATANNEAETGAGKARVKKPSAARQSELSVFSFPERQKPHLKECYAVFFYLFFVHFPSPHRYVKSENPI